MAVVVTRVLDWPLSAASRMAVEFRLRWRSSGRPVPLIEQGLYRICDAAFSLFALDDWVRSSQSIPSHCKTFENVLGVLGLGPLLVGVFNAEHERNLARASRKEPIENSRPGGADVKGSRRARGQTNANHAMAE